jgi:hypothetical protein
MGRHSVQESIVRQASISDAPLFALGEVGKGGLG